MIFCSKLKKLKSKSIYITILLMVVTSIPLRLLAKEYSVKDVPNVLLQDARQRVSDPEGLLSPAARDSVNRMLASLKGEDGAEVAVVMLPSIGDADLFDFAHQLFRTWGIGNKKSNRGLLLLYVADIRRVRFTVGDGLEGTMTDAACKRIIERTMIPHFKKGDTDGGVVAGISAACERIRGAGEAEEQASDEDDEFPIFVAILFVGGAVTFFFLLVTLVNRATRKCKYCGKVALRLVNTDIYRKNGRKYKRETFICGNCGKLTERVRDITDDDNGAAAAGFIAGSMLGGGRRGGGFGGGGGFSGGSWGGGTTSGGGASGGW